MFQHETSIRVRYAETDKMGYLYYGHYATYFEVARAEAVRHIGLSYQVMEDEVQVMMPVMSLRCRYIRPAYYDDLLRIQTQVRQKPDKGMVFHHEVFGPSGKLLCAGEVRLAFVNRQTGKRCPAPPYLMDKLAAYFEED